MSAAIVNNRLKFPPGYRQMAYPTRYKPYNGFLSAARPDSIAVAVAQLFNIASVPADLSTFILHAPNGIGGGGNTGFFSFQFVYNASVQTTGIKIPLPLSGATTAAQVQTAIKAVLSQAFGTPLVGGGFALPWIYNQTGAAAFRIDWTVPGPVVPATGTQATITPGATFAAFLSVGNSVVPGRYGKNHAFLPGT